jgi:hypothetical protein
MALTAFLIQAAESRIQMFESGECRERGRNVAEHALRERAQI